MILFLFSSLMAKESNRKVIDNLCAALCRMIMTSADSVPIDQVLSALVCILTGLYLSLCNCLLFVFQAVCVSSEINDRGPNLEAKFLCA